MPPLRFFGGFPVAPALKSTPQPGIGASQDLQPSGPSPLLSTVLLTFAGAPLVPATSSSWLRLGSQPLFSNPPFSLTVQAAQAVPSCPVLPCHLGWVRAVSSWCRPQEPAQGKAVLQAGGRGTEGLKTLQVLDFRAACSAEWWRPG